MPQRGDEVRSNDGTVIARVQSLTGEKRTLRQGTAYKCRLSAVDQRTSRLAGWVLAGHVEYTPEKHTRSIYGVWFVVSIDGDEMRPVDCSVQSS